MFEGNSADMCAGKFPLVSMGAERRVSRTQTRERGLPSALAEIVSISVLGHLDHFEESRHEDGSSRE